MEGLRVELKRSADDVNPVVIELAPDEMIQLTDTIQEFLRNREQYKKYGMIPKKKPRICTYNEDEKLKCTHTLPEDCIGDRCFNHS